MKNVQSKLNRVKARESLSSSKANKRYQGKKKS